MINQNVQSIQRNQAYMDISANNVANINTPSNKKNESKQSETNLTKEMTDQITIEKTTSANVEAIKAQDKMIGSLLDIKA